MEASEHLEIFGGEVLSASTTPAELETDLPRNLRNYGLRFHKYGAVGDEGILPSH